MKECSAFYQATCIDEISQGRLDKKLNDIGGNVNA